MGISLKKIRKGIGRVASKAAPIVSFFNPVIGAGMAAGGKALQGAKGVNALKSGALNYVGGKVLGKDGLGGKVLGLAKNAVGGGAPAGAGGIPEVTNPGVRDLVPSTAAGGVPIGRPMTTTGVRAGGPSLTQKILRATLSGGKPVTLGNVLGNAKSGVERLGEGLTGAERGRGPGAFQSAAMLALMGSGLKRSHDLRGRADAMLQRQVGLADEQAAAARDMLAGAAPIRHRGEAMMLEALNRGPGPTTDFSQFSDVGNPYRKRFPGMRVTA